LHLTCCSLLLLNVVLTKNALLLMQQRRCQSVAVDSIIFTNIHIAAWVCLCVLADYQVAATGMQSVLRSVLDVRQQ
jgi:hypothetical protein